MKCARTLSSLKKNCGKRGCEKHQGSIHPPLINCEPQDIVLDELHLLLRGSDVLLRNLINQCRAIDHHEREHRGGNSRKVRQLEVLVRSCGVSFQIWQAKDGDRRAVAGKYEWTALSGRHKLLVMQQLPRKLEEVLPSEDAERVAKLWDVWGHE